MQVRIGPNRVGPLGSAAAVRRRAQAADQGSHPPGEREQGAVRARADDHADAGVRRLGGDPVRPELCVIANINAGLLYLLALTSMGVYGVILAGWASNSKYAFLGAMRSAAQIVSYEIAMGFALVGVLMAARQPEPQRHRARAGRRHGSSSWFWLPLLPLFVVYFVSGVAETNRAPFDVAEGESEIVAGFHVEYSGIAFALFFLAEYANMILISALTVDLLLRRLAVAVRRADRRGLGVHFARGAELRLARRSRSSFFAVHLPVVPRHVPALPLRPDHAARLEGLHSGDARLDRASRACWRASTSARGAT